MGTTTSRSTASGPPRGDAPAAYQAGHDAKPPTWKEATSFRETMLAFLNDPADAEALRTAGQVLYRMALQAAVGRDDGFSATYSQVRSGLSDLHYLQGWFDSIERSAEDFVLTEEDAGIARLAGWVAGEVARLVSVIEEQLAPPDSPPQAGARGATDNPADPTRQVVRP